MHLSQPAFSALIRALEQQLGARLFDRTTRNVDLTAEGRVFAESARRMLDEIEAGVANLREHTARRRGRVALAVLPSLAAGWLPPLLARFHAAHPGIELSVADVLSEQCIERVRNGQADFALASARTDAPELRVERFCSDRFHLVCPRDHPLAARRSVRLADLAGHAVVQLSRQSSVRQYVEAAVHPHKLRTVMELDQLGTVAGMVRAGLGVAIVPGLTLFHFRDRGLVVRPVVARGLQRQVFLVRRADRSLSVAAQALHALLLAHRPADDGR